MVSTLKTERMTIVVVGKFNPAIVTPAWLEREGLVSKDASLAAEVELIAADLASFSVAAKQLQLLRERLVVSTGDAREEDTLRDLVVGILEILSHTPTSKVGLNYESHFLLSSLEVWHAKGDSLAPKPSWKKLLEKPGLRSLTMRDDCREGGFLDVTVGPSPQVGPPGLAITTNDHFEVKSGLAHDAKNLILEEWPRSLARSREIAQTLATEPGD